MAETTEALTAARDAVLRRDWVTAAAKFGAARSGQPLSVDDLTALAECHWWLGDLDAAAVEQREAYRLYLDAGDKPAAALVALDVGYTLSLRGDGAQGSGWMRRAMRLLENEPERAEHGYLEYVLGFEAAFEVADTNRAGQAAERVHALGQRFGDPNLIALGVLGQGRVLVTQGDVARGMPLLDEAMVAAVSDELHPGWAGNIYCHLMEVCYEIADVARAGEWTEATARWCEQMPGAGPFMGICRVHRAQVLQLRGAWQQAENEAQRVCEEFAQFGAGVVAEAHYQLAEIRRQRGDLAGADAAYREGHRLGRDPQPGLALLRLAQGQRDAAASSIRSALAAAEGDLPMRGRLLPAAVEISLAVGDVEQARAAAMELDEVAATFGTTGFAAQSVHARAAVVLAEGDPRRALPLLRQALKRWQLLRAPYHVGRTRLLLAEAYEALGDVDAARLERAAADDEFSIAGAAPRAAPRRERRPHGLTEREAQVLAMVASGKSNPQIAGELFLSVRTVERHLATIYEKLGVHGRSARAAAVGFALREGIVV